MDAPSGSEAGCFVYKPSHEARSKASKLFKEKPSLSSDSVAAFEHTWARVEALLQNMLAEADSGTVEQICTFLTETSPTDLDRIPVGLITTSTAGTLFEKVRARAQKDIRFINVPINQCQNLKSILKCVASPFNTRPAARLLNYDLESLKHHIAIEHYEKVLLYFSSGEALHGGVLSELIDVLDSFKESIPFMLIFETAVSIDLFQEKLTRRALRQVRGVSFSTASASNIVESIFKAAAISPDQRLWMGASVAAFLLERQSEHLQSTQAFVCAIKYMYMIHFQRSPLSILLDKPMERLPKEMVDAARKTKSFKAHVDDLNAGGKSKDANKLLKDDGFLCQTIVSSIKAGQDALRQLSETVQVLSLIHESVPTKAELSWSRIYVQAMSGQLHESATLRNLLLSVRALQSDAMVLFLDKLNGYGTPNVSEIASELATLVRQQGENDRPLKSEHDVNHETTRTTVVAKKIALSKQKSGLSKQDEAYSTIISKLDALLKGYFHDHLISPKELLFNEVFIFDLRIPLREAFSPRPRDKLEHALTVPGAYLACECCDTESRVLSQNQPAAAILYQLYLESGALINIADLWAAFSAVISTESGKEDEAEQKENEQLCLFYQALAELNYLGMVKSSRKKAGHLVKMRFLGL